MNAHGFRGSNGPAVVHDDHVEIKRALTARIGGARSSVVALADL
ncbi:hypothetical protein [Streptomyces sp. NPDC002520]